MHTPNRHHTTARKIRKHRVTGVYVTHEARKLRRRRAYREALMKSREYGKDVFWGTVFFLSLVVGATTLVVGGLLVIN